MPSTGMSSNSSRGLEEAERCGLPVPFVSPELACKLECRARFALASHPVERSAYDFQSYLEKVVAGGSDFALIEHAGHGINSSALHVYVVHAPIAALVRASPTSVFSGASVFGSEGMVVPWSPVVPVKMVLNLAGGDTVSILVASCVAPRILSSCSFHRFGP